MFAESDEWSMMRFRQPREIPQQYLRAIVDKEKKNVPACQVSARPGRHLTAVHQLHAPKITWLASLDSQQNI